jgi:hypothetical protein
MPAGFRILYLETGHLSLDLKTELQHTQIFRWLGNIGTKERRKLRIFVPKLRGTQNHGISISEL